VLTFRLNLENRELIPFDDKCVVLKRTFFFFLPSSEQRLTSETVQGAALSLEGIDHVHGGHSLPLGVLGVGDGVANHVFEENLQDASRLLVDETGDTFHAASSCQTTDGGLGDTLDVVSQDLSMTLGASFSETLSAFTTTRHACLQCCFLSGNDDAFQKNFDVGKFRQS